MLRPGIVLLSFLATVSSGPIDAFNKGTQKPDVVLEGESGSSRNRLMHISEFTDPDTGINPFLDIEEGAIPLGRKFMKDQDHSREEDPGPVLPGLDVDLMEGDGAAPRSKWNEKDALLEGDGSDRKWNAKDADLVGDDGAVSNTKFHSKDTDLEKAARESNADEVTKPKETSEATEVGIVYNQQGQKETAESVATDNTIVYAVGALVVAVAMALSVGVCWWRVRTPRSHVAIPNGDFKS